MGSRMNTEQHHKHLDISALVRFPLAQMGLGRVSQMKALPGLFIGEEISHLSAHATNT